MSDPSCLAEKQRSPSLILTAVSQRPHVRGSSSRDNADNGTASTITATATTCKSITVLGRKRKADALGRVSDSHLGGSNSSNNSNHASPAVKFQKKDSNTTDSSIAVIDFATSSASASAASAAVVGGRGSTAGWTTCPLCGKYSSKRYALGRGISAHLQAVHTPWKPSKMALKIQRRHYEERQRRQQYQERLGSTNHRADQEQQQPHTQQKSQADQSQRDDEDDDATKKDKYNNIDNSYDPTIQVQESWSSSLSLEPWEPTQQEIDDWDARVLEILRCIERDHHHHRHHATVSRNEKDNNNNKSDKNRNDKRSNTKASQGGGGLPSDNGENDNDLITSTTTRVGDNNPPPALVAVLGKDRSGQTVQAYRQSLPPFLQAAADGSLDILQSMVQEAVRPTMDSRVVGVVDNTAADYHTKQAMNAPPPPPPQRSVSSMQQLLDTRDRHLSTAEHWAAGGGHLECLAFLLDLRLQCQYPMVVNQRLPEQPQQQQQQQQQQQSSSSSKNEMSSVTSSSISSSGHPWMTKKMRRRDGKTCLHYAARNGQLACVQYLLNSSRSSSYCLLQQQEQLPTQQEETEATTMLRRNQVVNESSGDGTTPLHMACYGGHLSVVRYLIQQGADVVARNDWGCTAAHWVGMTLSTDRRAIRTLCRLLQRAGVSFTDRQSQGHTPLHKAAQKRNKHVIEWMAEDKKTTTTKKMKKKTEGSRGATSPNKDSEDDDDDNGAGLSLQEKELAGGADLIGHHCPSEIWTSVGGDSQFADWMKEIAHGW
jgi:ankyrin repeat protein